MDVPSEEEQPVVVSKGPPPKCAVLVIVPRTRDRVPMLRAIGMGPEAVKMHMVKKSNVSFFKAVDGTEYAITVSKAPDVRARMSRMAELCETLGCHRLALVNPGYTDDDLKRRHIKIPDHCLCLFLTDSDFMLDALSLELNHDQRNTLRGVFDEPPRAMERVPFASIEEDEEVAHRLTFDELAASLDYRSNRPRLDEDIDDDEPHDSIGEIERQFEALERQQRQPSQLPPTHWAPPHHHPHMNMGGSGNTFIVSNNGLPPGLDVGSFINGGLARAPITALSIRKGGPTQRPPEQQPISVVRRSTGGKEPRPSVVAMVNARNVTSGRVRDRMQQNRLRHTVQDVNGEAKKIMEQPRLEEEDIEAMCVTAENNECMICKEAHVTTAVLPCRHMLFCFRCINKWRESGGANVKCPACGQAVLTIIQLVTHFNADDEHKRRKHDVPHLEKVIGELKEEVETLEKRIQEIKEQEAKKIKK